MSYWCILSSRGYLGTRFKLTANFNCKLHKFILFAKTKLGLIWKGELIDSKNYTNPTIFLILQSIKRYSKFGE